MTTARTIPIASGRIRTHFSGGRDSGCGYPMGSSAGIAYCNGPTSPAIGMSAASGLHSLVLLYHIRISCNTLCATLPRFQRGPKIDNCDQAMLSFHHQMGNWATDGRVRDAGLHRRRGGETGLRPARDLQGVRGHLHRSRVSSRLHGIDLGGYKLQIYTELRKSLCKSC